jgi:hypothetical protein
MGRLSPDEISRFEDDGFLICRGLFSRDEIAEIAAAIDEISGREPRPGKEMVYLEDGPAGAPGRILSRIEKFAEFQALLGKLVDDPRLIDRLTALFGEPPVLFKEKINFKLAGGGGFEAHQDIQPGWDDYAPYFISVLITIDDSTLENGCLELAPGRHKRGMIGERWKPLAGKQLEGVEFGAFPTAAGDVVFFDCFTPHRSGTNRSGSARRNLYLTYNRRSDGDHRERYYADKRASYPPDCEREPGVEYKFRV